jgi:hypothetical protein
MKPTCDGYIVPGFDGIRTVIVGLKRIDGFVA